MDSTASIYVKDLRLESSDLRVNIVFAIFIMPYLVIRRTFRLLFGKPKVYDIFLATGLASTFDLLGKLRVPELVRSWIDVRTRIGFEKEVVEEVLAIRGDLFLDVGSGIGYYSALLSKNFETILAFEPYPEHLRMLQFTVAVGRLRNVTVLGVAVGDNDGSANLQIHSIGGRHSMEPAGNRRQLATFSKRSLPVRTVKLDSIVKGRVDLVKLDVEGAELRVVRGAEVSVRTRRIRRWVVEVHDKGTNDELQNYFRQREYETRWVDDRHLFASLLDR